MISGLDLPPPLIVVLVPASEHLRPLSVWVCVLTGSVPSGGFQTRATLKERRKNRRT